MFSSKRRYGLKVLTYLTIPFFYSFTEEQSRRRAMKVPYNLTVVKEAWHALGEAGQAPWEK